MLLTTKGRLALFVAQIGAKVFFNQLCWKCICVYVHCTNAYKIVKINKPKKKREMKREYFRESKTGTRLPM